MQSASRRVFISATKNLEEISNPLSIIKSYRFSHIVSKIKNKITAEIVLGVCNSSYSSGYDKCYPMCEWFTYTHLVTDYTQWDIRSHTLYVSLYDRFARRTGGCSLKNGCPFGPKSILYAWWGLEEKAALVLLGEIRMFMSLCCINCVFM